MRCINNYLLEGDIETDLTGSLIQTLEILDISGCKNVTGKLSTFQQWPKLQWLGINRTKVSGDLRVDIKPGTFPSLQGMGLGQTVYGAYTVMHVQDAPAVMKARHQIISQSKWDNGGLNEDDDSDDDEENYSVSVYPIIIHLSPESTDYHERIEQRLYSSERDPPFSLEMVSVGKRRGWRWSNYLGGFCDTHWLDPIPQPTDNRYDEYCKEYAVHQKESQKSLFHGYLDPPNPQEYRELCLRRPP